MDYQQLLQLNHLQHLLNHVFSSLKTNPTFSQSPSLENNSWHLFRSSKTEELKAGCIDTESPLFFSITISEIPHTPPFVKHPWRRHWAGQLLKHNWGCCRCRQGFPGARHTALLSCPYNTILGLYLDADTHTTTTVAPRIPTIPSQPNSSSILGSCHFQTFVSEQLLLARKN